MAVNSKNKATAPGTITSRVVSRTANVKFEIGFLLDAASDKYRIGFELAVVKVFEANGKRVFKKLDITGNEPQLLPSHFPPHIVELLQSLSDGGVLQYLANSGYSYLLNYAEPWPHFTDNARRSVRQYYFDQLTLLWPWLCEQQHTYFVKKKDFTNAEVRPAILAAQLLDIGFRVDEERKDILIRLRKKVEGALQPSENLCMHGGFIFEAEGTFYLPVLLPNSEIVKQFEKGDMTVPVQNKERVIRTIIPALLHNYYVDAPSSLLAESLTIEPMPQVLFREVDEKFLLLQPRFDYNGTVVNFDNNPENIMQASADGRWVVIERNLTLEKKFFDSLRPLHPQFQKPTLSTFFYLPFKDTMRGNWFTETVSALLADDILVQGVQELKTHRHNTNKPKWSISAGSGTDWFDMEVVVSFGAEIIPIHSIRSTLLKGQNMVTLSDGTFGMLPQEFVKQYGPVIKMSREQKDGKLRLSKLLYTLIEELPEQERSEDVAEEIKHKKRQLERIGSIESVQPGQAISATLRPYQVSGFQWFCMLDELGWGGCLADDMGLGKTLQAIAFLQYLQGKYKAATHLVICPTSLIYNWESELEKFCPSLRYHIYYGTDRTLTEEQFRKNDVIISSYGTIRNDVAVLRQFGWHYIFLDESQAIKNPDSLTAAALQLLTSKNRMILSGTPVQNNTFDLFAQFNFLNPGLLGTRDFFKKEFANPIDKENDAVKSAQLRKLIYPFLLRRNKEQVAKDLPDKTETVIWCTMGREQKAVYEQYKNSVRLALLEKIEEVGMAKAGMDLLQGLLRLRQICDSPVLLKDDRIKTKKSAKIDELMREIEENAGGHKMLIFSQFTEMLHLIEDHLRRDALPYTYLDGSTPADQRQEAVERFQEDPTIRVFLISLKAGGVGLNLTAADYVYIVDPWWNPAAEQQAIDRTHRIGQVNKVFAYKMICKDTVEEKILLLQQKKKQLASDLISEDAGFIKKLTRDDVAFLFS